MCIDDDKVPVVAVIKAFQPARGLCVAGDFHRLPTNQLLEVKLFFTVDHQ
jgi:hypothetical protein